MERMRGWWRRLWKRGKTSPGSSMHSRGGWKGGKMGRGWKGRRDGERVEREERWGKSGKGERWGKSGKGERWGEGGKGERWGEGKEGERGMRYKKGGGGEWGGMESEAEKVEIKEIVVNNNLATRRNKIKRFYCSSAMA